ncbi:MAG: hypothetical protein IPK25_15245 [Saprospiraceae bacterium]|nr:hypothetical protein [Saprospiraceae bacterium]
MPGRLSPGRFNQEIIEYSGDCADLIGQPYGDGTIFSPVRHTTITIHSEKHLTDGFVMANSAKAMTELMNLLKCKVPVTFR